ncbi:hypothetical protein MASR2M29_15980 [Spirochaetota bacterium]
MKQVSVFLFFLALAAGLGFPQEILTADAFFKSVSDKYSTINDYEALVNVTAGKQVMTAILIFKSPNLLRMDFSDPQSQVISYDGQNLVVYIPELRAVLTQQTTNSAAMGTATSEGLRMLSRNYSIVYESGPAAVELPGAESERVIRLVLSRLSVAEGFRTIKLSVNPDKLLIRRMEGTTLAGDTIVYDFLQIKLNQGIPATRFVYDSPASANLYNNFLFSSEN